MSVTLDLVASGKTVFIYIYIKLNAKWILKITEKLLLFQSYM